MASVKQVAEVNREMICGFSIWLFWSGESSRRPTWTSIFDLAIYDQEIFNAYLLFIGCDVVFIGAISIKREIDLNHEEVPEKKLTIGINL